MANVTIVTAFLLLGFSEVQELQLVHAMLFLLVYLAALVGNLLIVTITNLGWRLHTPMYFFLRHLSVLDLCLISITVPKSIHNSLINNRSISFLGCVLQVFFALSSVFTELVILTVMSYNRYVAISHPLHYEVVMNRGACVKMTTASWLSWVLSAELHTASTFSFSFFGSNVVGQFFCDIPQLLTISCSPDLLSEVVPICVNVAFDFCCFIGIIVSYIHIMATVLRMPATEGWNKTFSTCLPHLIIITISLSTGFFAYLKAPLDSPSVMDLLLSMFYTVVPPTLKPLIYSLRNRDLKVTMGKFLKGKFCTREKSLHISHLA
ncbi:olfactory receptor 14A16-like [Ornithorhynchus anatinus]|uniref:olfactory receptor 14A16-like n=1 Tax=Ornithorhynchus anatinus TaxID=9258 RepID=UPI0010A90C42|nr:olfactory receptor 14A16-like [Ornithorhynchus anatinus]